MRKLVLILLICLTFPMFLGGCATLSMDDSGEGEPSQDQAAAPSYEPYRPADFDEILIPGELTWNRKGSMTINTDSFTGGILNFTGRVEVNSLTDFFINTMKKNGWRLNGSVKSEDVLLAFTRDNGTCMIKIIAGGIAKSTNVFVYVSRTSK